MVIPTSLFSRKTTALSSLGGVGGGGGGEAMMAGEGKNIIVYLPIVISHYLPTCHPHSPHHALQISRLYHHHVHPRLDEGQHACVACQG